MRLRVFLALLAGALGTAYAGGGQAACGHQGVEVISVEQGDLAVACETLAETLSYFRRMGFEVDPRVTLTFADPAKARSVEGVSSYGYVDLRASFIVVYSSSYREPWGQPWSRKIAASFLRHELAHIAAWQILGPEAARRLPREWHEFIAYAIQLDLLDARASRAGASELS